MASYNKYYEEPDYFGDPYPELVAYFSSLPRDMRVLDIGCGQGRDSLAIGRLGFSVVGIDISSVGIEQLNRVAKAEGLNVVGVVSDLNNIDSIMEYDIVLLDSMLHFYKRDFENETKLLNIIINAMNAGSILVVFIQENKQRVNHLKSIFKKSKSKCTIKIEESFMYMEFKTRYYMISVVI